MKVTETPDEKRQRLARLDAELDKLGIRWPTEADCDAADEVERLKLEEKKRLAGNVIEFPVKPR